MKKVNNYKPEEKIKIFDAIFDSALQIYNHAREEYKDKDARGCMSDIMEDDEHALFEQAMEVLGSDIWDKYNKYFD